MTITKYNEVTDADFELAYKNTDNKKIIYSVCKRFSGCLNHDALLGCGHRGLWKCLRSHDSSYNRKFTTSLYQFVLWECQQEIKQESTYNRHSPIEDCVEESTDLPLDLHNNVLDIEKYIRLLPANYQNVLRQRFFSNLSLDEMAKIHSCSKQCVSASLKRALNKLKSAIEKEQHKIK